MTGMTMIQTMTMIRKVVDGEECVHGDDFRMMNMLITMIQEIGKARAEIRAGVMVMKRRMTMGIQEVLIQEEDSAA
jgi:hypothetical protein